jgi:hypothetical protein
MNIFFLHLSPSECAKMHVDKHVVKMILESTQLLCSAHHVYPNLEYKPPYKLTHKNHPSSIWTRQSTSNYLWLVELALELCKEYTYRYKKIHKCESYINDLKKNIPKIENDEFTPPLMAMPDTYKEKITDCAKENIEKVIESYRQYYFFEKSDLFKWKNRNVPEFILEYMSIFEN